MSKFRKSNKSLFIIKENNINKLDCDFIMKPRILFNDKNLTRTDTDLLSLIISLTLKHDYCFATNKYLANYINTSERTISYSLSKFKELKYIFVKSVNGQRRIYLNKEKIPTKIAYDSAIDCSRDSAIHCNHNINNNYKKEYKNKYNTNISINHRFKETVPYWLEHPEVCTSKTATEEEQRKMEELLKEYK